MPSSRCYIQTVSEPSKSSLDPRTLLRLAPWIVFAVALIIRLGGIGWGLRNDLRHQSLHPDETDVFLHSQAIEPTKGKFTPSFYNYGTFYLTELRVASDMVTTYAGAPKEGDIEQYWSWVARCNLMGRVLSAIAGSIMAALAYLIAVRAFGLIAGVIASSVMIVAPGLVIHARFQTVDTTSAMLATLAVYCAVRLLPREDEESLVAKQRLFFTILGGVAAGLSAGTKYTGGLAICSVLAALWIARRPKEMVYTFAATVVAFVVSTPGVLLESEKFKQDFMFEMAHSASGHGLVFEGTAPGVIFHMANLVAGSSLLIFLLGLVGVGLGLASKNRFVWVILAFVVPFYLAIGRGEVKFFRYTLPLFAPMAAFAGFAAVEMRRRNETAGKVAIASAILGVGGIPFGGLRGTADATIKMMGTDPRDAAATYLRTKGDVKVGLPRDPWFWSPSLFPDVVATRMMPWPVRLQFMRRDSRPTAVHVLNEKNEPTVFDSRLILEERPDYIVFSSFEYAPAERLFETSTLPEVETIKAFKKALESNYTLEREFGSPTFAVEDLQYIQPILWIWKRK